MGFFWDISAVRRWPLVGVNLSVPILEGTEVSHVSARDPDKMVFITPS